MYKRQGQLLAEPGKPVRGASTIIVEGGKILSIACLLYTSRCV
ncbi:hypothetical protein [Sphingopyxis bauzanensis]|nr:hypothetical protein [Sphingopyxis bauzanensis]